MGKKKKKSEKQEKEKVVYYDDNSQLSDMSGVDNSFNPVFKNGNIKKRPTVRGAGGSSFTDRARTFLRTAKMMLIPMFVVLGILLVMYLAAMGISSCVQ